jgi:hypothetical protein
MGECGSSESADESDRGENKHAVARGSGVDAGRDWFFTYHCHDYEQIVEAELAQQIQACV